MTELTEVPYLSAKQVTQLKKNNSDLISQFKYAQIIESIMHLINFTQLDIAYAMCRLSRYIHSPNHDH